MKASEAVTQIKNGQIKNYILLAGEDEAVKQQAFSTIMKHLNVEMPELNLSVFEQRPDPKEVIRSIETLPFMGERRVVVLKNTDVLSAAAGGDLTAPYEHANMPASNVFVIVQQGKADKRKAFV